MGTSANAGRRSLTLHFHMSLSHGENGADARSQENQLGGGEGPSDPLATEEGSRYYSHPCNDRGRYHQPPAPIVDPVHFATFARQKFG